MRKINITYTQENIIYFRIMEQNTKEQNDK